MFIFFMFLLFAIFIAFIVGLVNPSLILRWSEKPTRLKVFGWWVLATVVISLFIAIAASDTASETPEENVAATEITEQKDTLNSVEKQKEELIREIASIEKGIDFSTYHNATTVDALQMELVLFSVWANIIKENESSEDAEIKGLANKLKTKVANIQTKEFPVLRKQYGKIAAQIFWEHDIDISVNGTGNKYINVTGGLFAANKNKQDFQNKINEVLTLFRFNQARYRWYKGADEYTYYTMYEGKDSDLVTFKE